jgi:hypothetical protein
MKNEAVYKTNYTGIIKVGNLEIPCAVLPDGRRVLIQREVVGVLTGNKKGGLDRYLMPSNLQQYISDGLKQRILGQKKETFIFKGREAQLFEAEDLIDLCEMYLKARKDGGILSSQMHLADQAEVIVRAFAKVGIIALIDEATGYQFDRDRDELQKILSAYIAEELLPWQKRFPDEFYNQIYRLRGWETDPIKQRTPYLGKITNEVIYDLLPPGVLKELRKRNPVIENKRKYKHHQFLTEDIGNEHLQKQLTEIITLMRISDDWDEFEGHMFKAFENYGKGRQTVLNFPKSKEELKEGSFDSAIQKASQPTE